MKNKPTVAVFTLGCKTNSYESEQFVAALSKSGYEVSEGLKTADIYVLNTCAVTAEAESKSRQAVTRLRKLNPNCKIVVTGCAAEKNAAQFSGLENVTLVRGNARKASISELIESVGVLVEPLEKQYFHYIDAVQTKTRAYIKIQDGCDNFCAYCIVPYLRGRNRSRDITSIVNEIHNTPAREYVLTGIDISQYGKDIGVSLADLVNALSDVDARLRLGSIYQDAIDESLLKAMEKNVCRHLHLSLQSGADNTLRAMNRHYTTAQYASTVELTRKYYPDCGITTDVIVGYPTETDEDFVATCDFVKSIGFSDIHVFPYSPRKGAKAYALGKIDDNIMKSRVERLTEIKKDLKNAFLDKHLGESALVLIEEKKGKYFVGYTDNYIRVYVDKPVNIGEIVKVKLTKKYDEGAIGEL